MRSSTLAIAAAGSAAVLALAACSSNNDNSGSSGSSSSAQGVSATCKLDNPPKSSAAPPPTATPSPVANAAGTVGVILPDTTSSTRYTLYDAPLLQKAFQAAGIQSDIQNAGGGTGRVEQNAPAVIGGGGRGVIIDPTDPTPGDAGGEQEGAARLPGVRHAPLRP